MSKEDKIGITVKKNDNFSEWYTQIVGEQGAQLVDIRYGIQGFIVYRELGYALMRRVYDLLEEAVEEDEHEPFLFPVVIPEENLKKEEEHAGFTPEVFWITKGGEEELDKPMAMRPTGETALYPMYSLWIRSYRDLPYKKYQSRIMCYRNEMTTRPFIRGREFAFFETHDVFRTHKEAIAQIKKDMEIMHKVVKDELSIPFIFFHRPKWDKFLGAEDTYASDTLMPDGKRSQLSSTHDLAHNFAKVFDVKFLDDDGKKKFGWQTCFGPGIVRIIAALISIHGDDNGLVLPSIVAPTQIAIVPITFSKNEADKKKVDLGCKDLVKKLRKERYKVVYDDRDDQSPGFKFNKWELKGVPLRIEVGPREIKEGKVTIVVRTSRLKETVAVKDLGKEIKRLLEIHDKDIKRRAEQYFKDNTREAVSLSELKTTLKEHRGFVKVPWCSVDYDGEKCADKMKEETQGGVVCGVPLEKEEKVKQGDKCIVCGKEAKHIVHVSKTY